MPSLCKSLISLLVAAVAVSAQGGHHGPGRFSGRPSGSPNSSITHISAPHPTVVNGSQTGFPEPPRGPRNETHIPGPHPTDVDGNQLEARISELEVPSEPRNETHIPEPHFGPGNDTQPHTRGPHPHPTSLDGSPTAFPEPPHGPRNETHIPGPHPTDVDRNQLEARTPELEVPSEPRNETHVPEPHFGPGNDTQPHTRGPHPHPTSLDGSPTAFPEPPHGPRNETHIPGPHPTEVGGNQLEARISELEVPSEPRNETHVPEPHFGPGNDTQTHIPPPPPSGSWEPTPTPRPHTGTSKGPRPTPTITHTREMTTRPPWVGAGKRAATPTALTTTFPASAGSTTFPTAIKVSGSFDGKMLKYDRNTKVCQDQTETGEADAIFILADGATLSNVIIGANQAEGVHCKGTCTLNNVWWLDVCEDAATFKQTSGTSYINGGGAKSASDKVFQHNGFGTVSIKNFYVDTFGKLYRSCGNCSNNGAARHVIMDNIYSKNGGLLAGINTNFGDTAKISNSCVPNNKVCDRFKGTTTGEPTKIGSGPDGKYCVASNIKTSC